MNISPASRRRGDPAYQCWLGMQKRCNNPKQKNFKYYGGRGIRVAYGSFAEFITDVGPRPSRIHTIDRIDNGLDYQSGNCRWATYAEQNHNRRDNVLNANLVRIMREMSTAGFSRTHIAQQIGIKHSTVESVLSCRRWVGV